MWGWFPKPIEEGSDPSLPDIKTFLKETEWKNYFFCNLVKSLVY
jgi:hypothetical protein